MKIEDYLKLDEERLLLELIPPDERVAYAKKGAIARGLELFKSYFEEFQELICNEYCRKKTEFNSLIDGANIILALLAAHSQISSDVIVPFSVLVVKYGLEKRCNCK